MGIQLNLVKEPEVVPSRFASLAEAAGYLAALIDGEGSVLCVQKARNRRRRKQSVQWDRYIEFTNTDWSIIEAGLDAYQVLGMHPILRARKAPVNPKWKQSWNVTIRSRWELERFAQMVTLRSMPKSMRLAAALASYSAKAQYVNRRRPQR